MKRWLLTAAAAVLTLGGLASLNAPVTAGEYHPHHVRVPVHRVSWWWHAPRHHAFVHHATHVRATHAHAAHFHAPRHVAHRR
jgi:hypothetical protein